MLPFLIASVFGIVIFGCNIIFVNYNATHAIDYNLSKDAQNRYAPAEGAHANSGFAAPVAEPKKSSKRASGDSSSPKILNAAKSEAQNVNNLRVNDPARGIQSQAQAKKTGPSVNALSHTKTQNWLIQAGAFSIESSAVKVKNRIASLGYNVEIIKTGTEKPLFKDVVSAGNSGAASGDALRRLSSIGIDGYIITGRP
jgi:cell division protein FtsN